jgi:DHA1 family arabinose polymer transporter-like MFS transporter
MGNASGAYLAGLPIAFGYGIIYTSLVGAMLASFGVLIALTIMVIIKQKEVKYRKMVMNL